VTLAMIDAAAMQKLLRSPPTILVCGNLRPGIFATVDQDMRRRMRQRCERALEREHRRPIDVEAVDLIDPGAADARPSSRVP